MRDLFCPLLFNWPRFSLVFRPTPIQVCPRLSDKLGVKLSIKRDDQTGLATGGNKTRKLEFLIGAARKEGADAVITAGGPQSNHCRQTAAAAARAGLECHLVFGGVENQSFQGNRLLDKLLGVTEHWTPKGTRERKMAEVEGLLRQAGKRPYLIPVGGSNSIGAAGYFEAAYELKAQMDGGLGRFDRIVFATSSGGTQAGLTLGLRHAGIESPLTAISIDQVPEVDPAIGKTYQQFVCDIAQDLEAKLGLQPSVALRDFPIEYGYLGEGYGVVGDLERHAIETLARAEGMLLDPVYSGRAFGALLSMVKQGQIQQGERVLFWHTGGEAALFAYEDDLVVS